MLVLPAVVLAVASATPQPSLAAPGLQNANADEKIVAFFNETFAQQLSLQGLRVTTPNEIQSVLGFERQKQLLGCSDDSSSCLAELAGALGVDALVTGSVAKFGNTFAINLKIVSAKDAKPLSVASTRLDGENTVLEWLTNQARIAAEDVRRAFGAAAAPAAAVTPRLPSSPAAYPLRGYSWIPAGAGAIALAAGGAMFFTSASERKKVETGVMPSGPLGSYVEANAALERNGLILAGVGAAAVAAGAVMFFLPGAPAPSVAAIRTPNGFAFTFSGSLP